MAQEIAQKAIADDRKAQAEQQAAIKALQPVPVDNNKSWPYGNKDKNKEFDLSKLTQFGRLPANQVVAVNRAYNRDSKGNKLSTDVAGSTIQVFEVQDFKLNVRTAKGGGQTIYGMLGQEWEVLHAPANSGDLEPKEVEDYAATLQ